MHVLPMIGVVLLGWLLIAVVVAAFMARGARLAAGAVRRPDPASVQVPPLTTVRREDLSPSVLSERQHETT